MKQIILVLVISHSLFAMQKYQHFDPHPDEEKEEFAKHTQKNYSIQNSECRDGKEDLFRFQQSTHSLAGQENPPSELCSKRLLLGCLFGTCGIGLLVYLAIQTPQEHNSSGHHNMTKFE